MSTRRVGRTIFAVSIFAGVLGANSARSDPASKPREVVIQTADKMRISAVFYPAAAKGGAGAVLLPAFRSDRTAWDAVIEPLLDREVGVLAVDPRGHGRSAQQGATDLATLVEKRDASLFAAMYADAIAAVRWLAKDGGCDPKRIALVGAGVGGSAAFDATARHPTEVAAVVWLSPGPKYLGLDSLSHARAVPATTPTMLVAHASDAAGADALRAARPSTRYLLSSFRHLRSGGPRVRTTIVKSVLVEVSLNALLAGALTYFFKPPTLGHLFAYHLMALFLLMIFGYIAWYLGREVRDLFRRPEPWTEEQYAQWASNLRRGLGVEGGLPPPPSPTSSAS